MARAKLREQIVMVTGPGVRDRMLTPPASRFASLWIETSVKRSTRMRVLSKSREVGHPIKELAKLWELYEGGLSKDTGDGLGLVYFAPAIKDAAPKLVDQKGLFGEQLNPDDTVFDLLNDAICDVKIENEESTNFDKDLLEDFKSILRSKQRGIDALEIKSRRYERPVVADQQLGANAAKLLSTTPPSHRARIAGELDMVRVSNAVFELLVGDSKEPFRAVWTGQHPQELGNLLKKTVLVEGDLVFRPNGKPLRIEASYVREANSGDSVFAELPKTANPDVLTRPRDAITFKRLIGTWPGEESEEEIQIALEAMS